MSAVFCPKCRNDVTFVIEGNLKRCPACGYQYEISAAPPPLPASNAWGVGRVLRLLLILFLIMVGIVVVGVGVLFAGCMLAMKR